MNRVTISREANNTYKCLPPDNPTFANKSHNFFLSTIPRASMSASAQNANKNEVNEMSIDCNNVEGDDGYVSWAM